MADQPPRRWAAANDDVLLEIVRRIPCGIDRRNMGRACHSWRVALAKLEPPAPSPPLPWLLLPRADGPPTFSCVLSGCRSHRFFIPPGAVQRARYFGSYDGGWLFLAIGGQGQAQRHLLLRHNPFRLLVLPNVTHFPDMVYPPVLGVVKRDHQISIVAATLSCKPTEEGCIVAGIIDFAHSPGRAVRQIALWRMGDQVVLPPYWEQVPNQPMIEAVPVDLIHHDGAFHFLIRLEHIIVCEEPPEFQKEAVHLVPVYMYFQPRGGDNGDETVLARYLVESRKKLLMVVRYSSGRQHLPTSAFRVFQMKKFNNGEEDEPLNNGGFQYYWSELDKLEGRMLFVGRGCSRSYEAGDSYPAGMEGVYFLDDRSFAEAAMAFGEGANKLPYRCSDNGKWSGSPADSRVDRCFPSRGPSIYSPPVWLLP
uniref:KIB1-4 beta-propeller domain-containing protein n=1 Tax=Oryza nivara TaxID=4536 RepID=A0A0E0HHH6_ORYNI